MRKEKQNRALLLSLLLPMLLFVFIEKRADAEVKLNSLLQENWSLRESEFIAQTPAMHQLSNTERSEYNNDIYQQIANILPDSQNSVQIYFVKDESGFQDFIFYKNTLIAKSWKHRRVSAKEYQKIFAELKQKLGAPETKREDLLTTHTFAGKSSTTLFMVRSNKEDYSVKIYCYTNAMFKLILSE